MEHDRKTFIEPTDFDQFAQNYHEVLSAQLKSSGFAADYFATQKARITLAETPLRSESRVPLRLLDVGCGNGMLDSLLLAEMARKIQAGEETAGLQIDGVEVSRKSVVEAQARQLPFTSFQEFDGQHIPFEAETFDIIIFCVVMHHVPLDVREPLLRECRRVLKPGGVLFVFEHNPLNPMTQYIVKRCPFDADAILLRSGVAVALLKRSGFRVLNKRFINFFPNWRVFHQLRLLENRLGRLPFGAQYYLRAAPTAEG